MLKLLPVYTYSGLISKYFASLTFQQTKIISPDSLIACKVLFIAGN